MGYRFEWLLQEIRDGKTYPDRWPEKSRQPQERSGSKKTATTGKRATVRKQKGN